MSKETSCGLIAVSRPYDADYAAYTGADEPLKPWDLSAEVFALSGGKKDLLDIGCGSSRKTAPLAKYFRSIAAVDPSMPMLEASKVNFRKMNATNAQVIQGRGECLPFKDNSFDVVTCFLAGYHLAECYRVLRPGGDLLIEGVGPRSHLRLKSFFRPDANGQRGQYLNEEPSAFVGSIVRRAHEFFENVSIQNEQWDTSLSAEQIRIILKTTPLIRNFESERDSDALRRIEQESEGGQFKTTVNRILLKASKPRVCRV